MLQQENYLLKKRIVTLASEVKNRPFTTIPLIVINAELMFINNAQEVLFKLIAHEK